MVFVFQAGGRRGFSHSSSQDSLLRQIKSLPKQILSKRSTTSEPFPVDPVGSPVHDGSMLNFSEGRTSSAWDWTGSNLSVIEDVCFEAQSPDEAALVHAAKAYGFTLKERTPNHVTVQLPQGTLLTFDVLDVLPFDSVRRRMSIIVRHPETRKIVMYTKGADSGVMERLHNGFKGKI